MLAPHTTDSSPGVIPRNVVLHGVRCGYRGERETEMQACDIPGDLGMGRRDLPATAHALGRELLCVVLEALRHRAPPLLIPTGRDVPLRSVAGTLSADLA